MMSSLAQLCPIGWVRDLVDRPNGRQVEGMMRAWTAAVLLAAVLAAGCGDDGDDSGGSPDDATTTSSPGEGATVDTKADQQAAEDAILVQSDLPAGWADADDDSDDGLDEAEMASDAALANCLGVDLGSVESDETDGEPTADSMFGSAEGLSVDSDVQVNPTAAEGAEVMAALAEDGAADCYEDGFEAYADASAPVEGLGEVSVEALDFEPMGDGSAAFRVTIPVETAGMTTVFLTDVVLATKGRATVSMEFSSSASEAWDAAEALRLTELVLDRIPADL
jgi:hypothetical protein